MVNAITCTLVSSSKLEFSNSRLNVLFRPLGMVFDPIYVDKEGFWGSLKKLVKVKDGVVFLNLPLGLRLPFLISLIFLFKPRKMIIFIPPHYRYEVYDFRFVLSIIAVRLLLNLFTLFKRGVLIVYPTIFEKKALYNAFRGLNSVYLPIYWSSGRFTTDFSSISGVLSILFILNDWGDLVLAENIYSVLRKTFGNVKLVLMDPTHRLQLCLSSPGLICVHSEDYREFISDVDVVILKHTGDSANQILFDAIYDTKVILVDYKIGLSYYLKSSGFINLIVVDKWDPDKVMSNILLAVNMFDTIKKSLLNIKSIDLNPDFGLSYIMNFIVE